MDKKKKKYIVLTIIAVLLIGLLILINVIGAGTKSASAESTDTTVTEEYTDITQFAPSGYSKYLIYPASDESTNSGYKIVWFSGSVEPGFLNNYPQIINNDTLHLSCAWPIIGALGDQDGFTNWLMTTLDPNNMVETDGYINGMIYPNCAIKSTIYRSGTDLLKVSNEIYTSIDSLITSLINKKVRYVSAGHIISDITITMTDDGIYSDQDIYSNYEEISLAQIVPLLDNLYAVSNIPKDISQRVIDEANQLIKAKEDGYNEGKEDGKNEGYQSGLDATRNEIFSSASLVSAKMEDGTNLNAPLNITAKGIAFTSIALVADDYAIKNNLDGADKHFTIIFNIIPFAFSKNQIYLSMSYGFYSLVFIDENNTRYNMEWDSNNKTKDGYAIYPYNNETIYQNKIKQIQIEFADIDHTGSLIIPSSSNTENAYNTGYNEGKSDGYKNGYAEGLATGNGPLPTISKLFSTVNSALQVNLIGDISLQDLLNIMLCVTFVIIALKLFAGG